MIGGMNVREIKFRVFDPNTNSIVGTDVGIDKIHLFDFDGDNITEQEGLVIMQYTGLKDKNSKEIYFDSDFVKLKVWTGYEPPSVCSVTHDVIDGREAGESIYSGIITKDEFSNPMIGDFYFANLAFADKYEFEVIGNIYENPELINEGDTEIRECLIEETISENREALKRLSET